MKVTDTTVSPGTLVLPMGVGRLLPREKEGLYRTTPSVVSEVFKKTESTLKV